MEHSDFSPALWDDSDPLYTPTSSWSGKAMYWKAPAKYRRMGFTPSSARLPGYRDDGRDLERAAEARRLTRAMLAAYGTGPAVVTGTWHWLIERYRQDEFSPIHEVKANTRINYEWMLQKWDAAIGPLLIRQMTYEQIKRIQKAMADKGRSDSYVHRMFTMLRTVASYGRVIKSAEAKEVSEVLSEIRFRTAPKRSVAPTREQIRRIVDEADARGMHDFAAGLLLQWVYAMRAVDIRGQWFEITEAQAAAGGVVRRSVVKRNRKVTIHYSRWQDGLTWDMIEPDLTGFSKVISKTERSTPEPMRFDLTNAPELRSRLRLLGNSGKVGPVIRAGDMPYSVYGWAQAFRRLRTALDLPDVIKAMDARAGALTEAARMGADPFVLRDAAGHANVSTTDVYVRGRDHASAKVVKLRGEG